MLVDLREDFDMVNHDLILLKLDLNEQIWFKSYLNERYQSVKYISVLSDPLPITTGVPQGSIHVHADDATLYAAGKCVADINRSLTKWMDKRKPHGCKRR